MTHPAQPSATEGELAGPEAAWAPAEPPLARPLNALAIDTTAEELSLALAARGELAAQQYDPIGRRTTQEILPRIRTLLADAGLTPAALDVLVVARGPGSFTGTRIGMAVALTFAQVNGTPLVGVDTLRLLAAMTAPDAAPAASPTFSVLLNCARDEVYHARYRWQAAGLARVGGMTLRSITSLRAELGDEPVVLRRFRPGAGTSAEAEAAFAGLRLLPLRHAAPDGARLLAVGLGRYLASPALAGAAVAPIYLKSEAFRTWQPPPRSAP